MNQDFIKTRLESLQLVFPQIHFDFFGNGGIRAYLVHYPYLSCTRSVAEMTSFLSKQYFLIISLSSVNNLLPPTGCATDSV